MQNIFPILSHDRSLLIKIGDFGCAKFATVDDPLITQWGTAAYQAPEVLDGDPYTKAVDIWSLGCLFVRLWTGKPWFDDRKMFNSHIMSRKTPPCKGITETAALGLVTWMLQMDPLNRPTAQDALSHVWFQNQPGLEALKVNRDVYQRFTEFLGQKTIPQQLEVHPIENTSETNGSSSGETFLLFIFAC